MSTAAAATPTLTGLPERAFSLHCSGLRSPAIAAQLGVPERTVRSWIARIRDDLAADNTALLRDEFLRALEHLHQLSAAAWAAFDAEQAASQSTPPATTAHNDDLPSADASTRPSSLASASPAAPLLARGAARGAASDDAGAERAVVGAQLAAPVALSPVAPRHAPRYLRLALDAQRHISRLFGHFDDLRTELLAPASAPAPTPILAPVLSPTPSAETGMPAKTAIGVTSIGSEIPAKTAMPHPCQVSSAPAAPPPAQSYSQSRSPSLVASLSSVVQSRFPAESATSTSTPGLAAGIQPAKSQSVRAFPASIPLHWRM